MKRQAVGERRKATVQLSERDLSCLRFCIPFIRGVEERFGEQAGIREGEATSDVIAAIVARAEAASPASAETPGTREDES